MRPTLRQLEWELVELIRECEPEKTDGALENFHKMIKIGLNPNYEQSLKEIKRLEDEGKISQGSIDLGRALALSKMRIMNEGNLRMKNKETNKNQPVNKKKTVLKDLENGED